VRHTLHRHEPPLPRGTAGHWVQTIHEDERVLVVDKPAAVPVHPCGPYRHNSLLAILAQQGRGLLYPVHRLDRLTSGVLILAKTRSYANTLVQQIRRGSAVSGALIGVHGGDAVENVTAEGAMLGKRYLAMIAGSFPFGPQDGSPDPTCVTAAATACSPPPKHRPVNLAATASCRFLQGNGPKLTAEELLKALAASEDDDVEAAEGDQTGEKAGNTVKNDTMEANRPCAAFSTLGADVVGWVSGAASASPAAPEWWLRVSVGVGEVDGRNAIQGATASGHATPSAGPGEAESHETGPRAGQKRPRNDTPEDGSSAGAGGTDATRLNTAHLPFAAKDSVTLLRPIRRLSCAKTGEPLTLLECVPLSGRSHQIRVHLAWLGFPIDNDPLYRPAAYDALRALDAAVHSAGSKDQEIRTATGGAAFTEHTGHASHKPIRIPLTVPTEPPESDPSFIYRASLGKADGILAGSVKQAPVHIPEPLTSYEPSRELMSICRSCCEGEDADFNIMHRLCEGIHLHSLEYRGNGWCYRSKMPAWATDSDLAGGVRP
jgi:23S rRNA-/tRNA-specific pseudouridylate synthase